jgi:anti-sigma factor RsiW
MNSVADFGDLPCQDFVEMVTDYLEGTLPPKDRARFEAHLADCDYCVDYLAQIRQTIHTLGQIDEPRIAPTARERLLEEFREWKRSLGSAPAF